MRILLSGAPLILFFLFLLFGCVRTENKIIIFHAGSLSGPFAKMEKAFEEKYSIDVQREAEGSVASVKKITELGKKADILAVSDYRLIEEMEPRYAEWVIRFAKNKIVLAYTKKSKYANEINEKNWFEILERDGVEIGHSNPNTDPCGYRSLIVWKLAEKYYGRKLNFEKNVKEKNIRNTETELISILQVGELDYIFIYRSLAEQHKLPYIQLPEEIDLSETKHKKFYESVNISTRYGIRSGAPIVYGLTIPKENINKMGGIKFVKFVLSEEGNKILRESGFIPQVEVDNISALPEELQELVRKG